MLKVIWFIAAVRRVAVTVAEYVATFDKVDCRLIENEVTPAIAKEEAEVADAVSHAPANISSLSQVSMRISTTESKYA